LQFAETNPEILQLLQEADAAYAEGRWPETVQLYGRVLEIDPNYVPAMVQRGLIVREMGDAQAGMQDFDRALQLDPDYAPAYYGRGWVRHAQGDYQGELEDAEHAIHLDPGNAEMYFVRLGAAYHGLGQYDKAIDIYTRAIDAMPGVEGTIYNRALCYFDMGEYKLAIEDLDAVLKLDPDWAWALRARGMARAAVGDVPHAIADLTDAIKYAPDDATAYLYRGLVYTDMSYEKWGREDLQRVLTLTDDPEMRETAEKTLAELGEDTGGMASFFKKLSGR
jgi:regulator of sirC expression with transglutaminase-like and TPR domain